MTLLSWHWLSHALGDISVTTTSGTFITRPIRNVMCRSDRDAWTFSPALAAIAEALSVDIQTWRRAQYVDVNARFFRRVA